MNIMNIAGHKAVVSYDPDLDMLRGEFLGLNGGADFYASDIASLKIEAEKSLKAFLQTCKEHDIEPYKHYSGKFQARISPILHERAAEVAAARGISMNMLLQEALEHEVGHTA